MAVVALVSDLIFESKITATARHGGVEVRIVRTTADALAAAPASCGLIVDLNLPSGDALELVRAVKAAQPRMPVVGFLSHVQAELARRARAAGCDEVLPRSAFTQGLPGILTRLDGAEGRGRGGAVAGE